MTVKVLLAIPFHRTIPGDALESFMRIAADGCLYGKIFERKVAKGALLPKQRNDLCQHAVAEGLTHVWFVDSDMILKTATLDLLLSASKPDTIVGALCFTQRGTPSCYVIKEGFGLRAGAKVDSGLNPADIVPNKLRFAPEFLPDAEVASVDGIGMACTLIPVPLLERMSRPWFALPPSSLCDNVLGEDVYFCEHRPPDSHILVLPQLTCGHIKEHVVWGPGGSEA